MSTPLARLAPKTLVPTGEGFGGSARLEQCDVAYALAGLRAGPAALLRAIWAGDHGQANMRALHLWAWQEAAQIAIDNRWAVPQGVGILRKMSDRAVSEVVHKGLTQCQSCNGTTWVQPNQHNPTGACAKCSQTGLNYPTPEEMAAIVGVSTIEWVNLWALRYMRVLARMMEWNAIGIRHVRSRLREDETA